MLVIGHVQNHNGPGLKMMTMTIHLRMTMVMMTLIEAVVSWGIGMLQEMRVQLMMQAKRMTTPARLWHKVHQCYPEEAMKRKSWEIF